jgi:hypothetical protein
MYCGKHPYADSELQLSDPALPILERFIKLPKAARFFRRVQAAHEVVTGQRSQSVW